MAYHRRTRSQSTNAPDRRVVLLYSGECSAGTSYSVAAPKLCNSLPANIRNLKSLDTSKKHLKKLMILTAIIIDFHSAAERACGLHVCRASSHTIA